jgi:hypothetical protein
MGPKTQRELDEETGIDNADNVNDPGSAWDDLDGLDGEYPEELFNVDRRDGEA